jgi:hypothetical protein
MRKYVRDQIITLLQTIWAGTKHGRKASPADRVIIFSDCCAALTSISNSLRNGLTSERFAIYEKILAEIEMVFAAIINSIADRQSAPVYFQRFRDLLSRLKKELINEAEVKIEIVFMPYKASMWDSFESVWLAAKNDECCNPIVMPIPYYDRNPDQSFGALHYEGEKYPDYVPVVHYDRYDLHTRKPDIIYIHNPYDEGNYITTVDPRFYSYNLKKFTAMLVYIPYFIAGAYVDLQAFAQKHVAACVHAVDKIIVQSNKHKQLYVASGVAEKKILALGSPKLDAIVKPNTVKSKNIPEDWLRKSTGKKTVVLNSSIGSLLNDPDYLTKLKARLEIILSYDELTLIWRPHPLLETTILSMRPAWHEEYKALIRRVANCDNAIMDQSADTMPATIISDGMISDMSSWARQYIATGKPVLLLNGKSELKKDRMYVFDHFSCYFLHDGCSIENFCDMIINGSDAGKNERMIALTTSMLHTDGSCGKRIHKTTVSLLE